MTATDKIFNVFLIRPSHYDRDGYPIRWWRSILPSNSLACMYTLTEDCAERQILGSDVEIRITLVDEVNERVDTAKLIRQARRDGGRAIVGLVGVQSNQFPRAMDIAGPFLAEGLPVCVGGFHVSGCISMLPELPDDLKQAQAQGVSFFLGEAEEHRLDEVYRDAWNGKLEPIYDHLSDLPNIAGEPGPFVPPETIRRGVAGMSSFDLGRGCPFQCSFCSIINVHGRKSRYRTPDDLEAAIRRNYAIGVDYFFVTDDNLARNREWEAMLDRIIALNENEGIKIQLAIQVDTLCHRIPNFIEKCVRAGVVVVFIGMENINPDNLATVKKKQNHISEYRQMLLAWKKHPVFVSCGYIIGFPFDTKESVLRDVEIIKNELPMDALNLSLLTPLPGSEDHKKAYESGQWMDPDMNKYDLCQRVSHHPVMSDAEWDEAYEAAWRAYYTPEHIVTVLRRLFALRSNKRRFTLNRLVWYYFYSRGRFRHYRQEGGFLPMRARTDRRPQMGLENPLVFYPRNALYVAHWLFGYVSIWCRFRYQLWKIGRDPRRFDYRDTALAPPGAGDEETLGLFTATRGGRASLEAEHKQAGIVARARAGLPRQASEPAGSES